MVLAFFAHVDPCPLGDGEYVWRVLVPPLAAVLVDDRVRVEREVLVRVDGY